MPYATWDDINPAIKGIKPRVTLEMANHIADMADAMTGDGKDEDAAWPVAIAAFKKEYKVSGGRWQKRKVSENNMNLTEATWTAAFVNDLPDSSFALILPGGEKDDDGKTTPRALRKLPYKDSSGKVDLPHLRNALARVSQIEGASQAQVNAAKKKLQAVAKEHIEGYEAEAAEMYTDDEYRVQPPTPFAVRTFADLDAAGKAAQLAERLQQRADQFFMLFWRIWNDPVLEMSGKLAAWDALFGEFKVIFNSEIDSEPVDESGKIGEIAEAQDVRDAPDAILAELAENNVAVETGRRAPVLVDFQILKPGPGNKKDNHFYPADVVERDIHVFERADVFATDHREDERSERTKVGIVQRCPASFTDDGAPIARVLLYDPDQAEKARNRADAKELGTLECSIFGNGNAQDEKINGHKYKKVTAITEGRFLELVSKAGAGGKALRLAEMEAEMNASTGAQTPEEEQEVVTEATAATPPEPVAVAISESETAEPPASELLPAEQTAENAAEPAPVTLSESEVKAVLDSRRLPLAAYKRLAEGSYSDAAALETAITAEIAYITELTGSGKPTAQHADRRAPERIDIRKIQEAQDAANRRHGF